MKYWYILFVALWIFFFLWQDNKKKVWEEVAAKRKKGGTKMKELLKTMLGKTAYIYCVGDGGMSGIYLLKEVVENGLLCEDKGGASVLVNIEYIVSVQEVKEKKKKEKTVE